MFEVLERNHVKILTWLKGEASEDLLLYNDCSQ